jgi:PAS domain S-box-containing protein
MGGRNGKTILLVEDEAVIALSERMELEKRGYGIIMASSGEEAMESCAKRADIDLILMDINLGKGIDGTEAARRILKDRDIPIVFLSSHSEPEVVEKSEKITSYGYILKNSSITVLDAAIKMAFRLFGANKKIRKNETRQEAIISNINAVISIYDSDGILNYASPNIEKVLGWTSDELIGTEAASRIHPDDLEIFRNSLSVISKADGSKIKMEIRFLCKDSTYKYVSLTAANFMNNESINGILVSYHDISDRKKRERELAEKEELFTRLAEFPIAGVYILQDDRIVYANPGFASLFGYPPEDIIGKLRLRDIVSERVEMDRSEVRGEMAHRYCKGIRRDGATIDIELFENPISYRERPGRLGVLVDLAEQKSPRIRSIGEEGRRTFPDSP